MHFVEFFLCVDSMSMNVNVWLVKLMAFMKRYPSLLSLLLLSLTFVKRLFVLEVFFGYTLRMFWYFASKILMNCHL